jgi:hypothetical protein
MVKPPEPAISKPPRPTNWKFEPPHHTGIPNPLPQPKPRDYPPGKP